MPQFLRNSDPEGVTVTAFHCIENFGFSDTVRDWNKFHFGQLSRYPMIFSMIRSFLGQQIFTVTDVTLTAFLCIRPVDRDLGYVKSCENGISRMTCISPTVLVQTVISTFYNQASFGDVTKPQSTFLGLRNAKQVKTSEI